MHQSRKDGAQEMLDYRSQSYRECTPNYFAPSIRRTSSKIQLAQTPGVLRLLKTLHNPRLTLLQKYSSIGIMSRFCITIAQTTTESSFNLRPLDDLLNIRRSSSTSLPPPAQLRPYSGLPRFKNRSDDRHLTNYHIGMACAIVRLQLCIRRQVDGTQSWVIKYGGSSGPSKRSGELTGKLT